MVRATLFSLGVVLLLGASSRADNEDPIKAKLDKAKATFDEQSDKQRATLLKGLDDREDAARKAGNKKAVDQIKAEREGYEVRGELPKSISANELREMKQSRTNLELAYTNAIKEYVKAKKDTEAAAIEKELAVFKESASESPLSLSALLVKDSVWNGIRRVSTEKGKTAEDAFQLKVTAREGKGFKGGITIDLTRKYDVDGLIDGDKITFATTNKGKFKNNFEGRLRNRTLELSVVGTGQGGEPTKGIVAVTLEKSK